MPICTITRTHLRGKKLDQRDWSAPVKGAVEMASIRREDLNRVVQYLHVGSIEANIIPPLWEPHWLTYSSARGMVVVGFEEIEGARYYQGWYVQWE